MAVGLVNSLRAVTVTLASAALFCSPAAPQQCLSAASLASAAIITSGCEIRCCSEHTCCPWLSREHTQCVHAWVHTG